MELRSLVTIILSLLGIAILWQVVQGRPQVEVVGAGTDLAAWRASLGSPDARIRRDAILRLGAARDAASYEAVAAAVTDPDPMTRELSFWALGRLGDRRAVPALCDAAEMCLDEGQEDLPVNLVPALGALGDPSAVATLEEILDRETSSGVRVEALRALGRIGSDRAREVLQAWSTHGDEDERVQAREALAGGHRTPELAGGITSPGTLELRVEDVAEAHLELFHPVEAGPLLLSRPVDVSALSRTLAEGQADDRCNAALVLGTVRDLPDEALAALKKAGSDPDVCVRVSALKALALKDPEASIEGLLASLDSPDEGFRREIVEALGDVDEDMADHEVLEAALRALRDTSPEVRLQAVCTVANLFPERSGDLAALQQDPDPAVRDEVERVLNDDGI